MAFQPKPLAPRIAAENETYLKNYGAALAGCNRWSLFKLREILACMLPNDPRDPTGACLDAAVDTLILRGDVPTEIDSTGRKWT